MKHFFMLLATGLPITPLSYASFSPDNLSETHTSPLKIPSSTSEDKAHLWVNRPWSSGFEEYPYRVHAGDINADGRPDFKIDFDSSKSSHAAPAADAVESIDTFKNSTWAATVSDKKRRDITAFTRSREVGRQAGSGEPDPRPLPVNKGIVILSNSTQGYQVITDIDRVKKITGCRRGRCYIPWQSISATLLWGDINGNFQQDMLLIPRAKFLKGSKERLPSLAIISASYQIDADNADKPYKTQPHYISHVIDHQLFGNYLSDFPVVSLVPNSSPHRSPTYVLKAWKLQSWPFSPKRHIYQAKADAYGTFKKLQGDGDEAFLPSQLATCPQPIKTPPQGVEHYLNERCDTAYIVPPASGYSRVEQMNPHSNLTMCPRLGDIRTEHTRTTDEIVSLQHELLSLINLLIDGREYQQLRAAHVVARNQLNTHYKPLKLKTEIHLKEIRIELEEAEADWEDGIGNEQTVLFLRQQEREAKAQLDQATFDYLLAVDIEAEAARALSTYVNAQLDHQTAVTQLIEDLMNLNLERRRLIAETSVLEGGTITFSLNTGWSALIDKYQQKNPDIVNLFWKKMPITSGRLISGLPSDAEAELLGILWTRMIDLNNQENFREDDKYGAGARPTIAPHKLEDYFGRQPKNNSKAAYQGQMAMNLVALCSHYPTGIIDTLPDSVKDLPSLLSLTLRQNYQVQSGTGYRMSFNLSAVARALFSFVVEHGRQHQTYRKVFVEHYFVQQNHSLVSPAFIYHINGHQLRAYINSLEEELWFKLRFINRDYTLTDQESIRTDLKKKIIDLVLSAITVEYRSASSESINIMISSQQLERFIRNNDVWHYHEEVGRHNQLKSAYTDFRTNHGR